MSDRCGSLIWKCRDHVLELSRRPVVMGVLNVTPDSFSDGGRYLDHDVALRHGRQLVVEGADIVDVGGESTRPGAGDVSDEEEIDRVVPVIATLVAETDVLVSVDTRRETVARRALEAGAHIINDVSAFTHDERMADLARATGAGVVLMHMQGTPRTMQTQPNYGNVVEEVAAYLESRVEALVCTGVERDRLAIDPGIGFGKTVAHNVELLRHLARIGQCGRPVLIGLSRKSFLGKLTGAAVDDRLAAGLAALVYCVLNGAAIMRVHDVKASRDAVRMAVVLGGIDDVDVG